MCKAALGRKRFVRHCIHFTDHFHTAVFLPGCMEKQALVIVLLIPAKQPIFGMGFLSHLQHVLIHDSFHVECVCVCVRGSKFKMTLELLLVGQRGSVGKPWTFRKG